MICPKCNHRLPDDSEFCQYCGNRIEKAETQQTEEALDTIIKFQAEQTVKNLEGNSQNQPDNERDADFGLVPEKPIYTLALKSVDGEIEYLNRLYTENGVKVGWERQGSMSVDGVSGIIDIYHTYFPSGEFYKTIYINMYGAKASRGVPKGFSFAKSEVPQPVVNNGMQTTRKNNKKPKKNKLDIINIFVLLLTIILAIIGSIDPYYTEGVFISIFVVGFIPLLLKILNVVKLKNNIVVTIIIAISLVIMICCSLAGEVEIGLPICLTTLYLLVYEMCKIIKRVIEIYQGTNSYRMKCYKKIYLLNEYREKGVISETEYEDARKRIISKIRN